MTTTKQTLILISILVLGLLIPLSVLIISYVHAADFKSAGDWGCRSAAVSNIKNLARDQSKSFIGVGDIVYSCSTSSIKSLWDAVPSRKTVFGNHECEKSQGTAFVTSEFGQNGCSKGYFAVTRGGDTGVIGLNPYASYKKGSGQYNFVVSKTNEYANRSDINWIVYIAHPLFFPIGCASNHCHGVDFPGFNSIYLPIIKSSHKGFILQGHTHLTSAGVLSGVPTAICGGGGENGTRLAGLNGYSWGTAQPGYCLLHFDKAGATLKLIATNNQVIHTHNWNR